MGGAGSQTQACITPKRGERVSLEAMRRPVCSTQKGSLYLRVQVNSPSPISFSLWTLTSAMMLGIQEPRLLWAGSGILGQRGFFLLEKRVGEG